MHSAVSRRTFLALTGAVAATAAGVRGATGQPKKGGTRGVIP